MTKATSRPFDSADYIDTPEAVATYLEGRWKTATPQIIAATLGDIARSKGMATIAERTGLAREALYKSLSADGNPRLTTLLGEGDGSSPFSHGLAPSGLDIRAQRKMSAQ